MSGRNAKFLRKIAATYPEKGDPHRRVKWWKGMWARMSDRSKKLARKTWPYERRSNRAASLIDLRVHSMEDARLFFRCHGTVGIFARE